MQRKNLIWPINDDWNISHDQLSLIAFYNAIIMVKSGQQFWIRLNVNYLHVDKSSFLQQVIWSIDDDWNISRDQLPLIPF